jgi:hypothetical protein
MESKISKTDLKNLHETFSKFQEAFNKTFSKSFIKVEFTDIKTFRDACEAQNVNEEDILSANDAPDESAYKKLKVIIKAINNGWTPDWDNLGQKKWWPYFSLSSGFGFSITYDDCGGTDASVGSRLCFESEEKAKYAGIQFLSIYQQFLK